MLSALSSRPLYNFYPRPPRGGRPGEVSSLCKRHGISIHALREEGDCHKMRMTLIRIISIHALREEGDAARAAVVRR